VIALALLALSLHASTPRLLDCAGKPVVRPASFVIACADANTELTRTRWTTWTASTATGTTRFGINFCKPYCAASKLSYFPRARVRLVAPKHGLFTRIVVTYVLHGKTKTFVGYPRTR
jgi:hypothetical protein